jgi:hypothetical protein
VLSDKLLETPLHLSSTKDGTRCPELFYPGFTAKSKTDLCDIEFNAKVAGFDVCGGPVEFEVVAFARLVLKCSSIILSLCTSGSVSNNRRRFSFEIFSLIKSRRERYISRQTTKTQ